MIIIAAFHYLMKLNKASSGQSTPLVSLQRVPQKRCEIGLKKEATEPEPEFERLYFFRNRPMGRKKDIFDKEDIKRVEAFEGEEQKQEMFYKFGFPRKKHPKEGKRGWRPEITYDLVKVEREEPKSPTLMRMPHMFDVFSDEEEQETRAIISLIRSKDL